MAADYRGDGGGSRKSRSSGKSRRPERRRSKRGELPFQPDAGDAVMVNAYSEKWLRRGFCWVYKDEVVGRTGTLQPGQVVSIVSREGKDLGTGVWDSGKVEVRRLRESRGPIDTAFISELVARSRARRTQGPATGCLV